MQPGKRARKCLAMVARVRLHHSSETKSSLPWREQRPGFLYIQQGRTQKIQAPVRQRPARQAPDTVASPDRDVRSWRGNVPTSRLKCAPRMAHGNVVKVYPPCDEPMGRPAVRLPVDRRVFV